MITPDFIGDILSDFSLGLLALWQGLLSIAERKLRAISGLNKATVENSVWFRVKKVDSLVFFIIAIVFLFSFFLKIYFSQ